MVLLLGVAMGLCVGLAFIIPYDENHQIALELHGWFASMGIAFSLGVLFWIAGHLRGKKRPKGLLMRQREAMGLVGIGWVVCSVIASLPYCLCEPKVNFSLAFFEAVSGLTTTGATIFPNLEELPVGILLWRSLTQWVGAMGILAMFVVILSGMGMSSKALIGAESSLSNSDLSTLRQTMRKLWGVYLIATIVCGIGLKLLGLSPFQAVNYSMTAAATGGFGTENDSVYSFTVGVKLWLSLFMVASSVTIPMYFAIGKMKFSDLRERYEEVFWFLPLMFGACVLLVLERYFGNLHDEPIDIIFNVISFSTSTGFVSGDHLSWSRLGISILFLFMIVGGCSGSTSGGLKVARVILWMRIVHVGLQKALRPKLVLPIRLNGKSVQDSAVAQLFLVLTFFGALMIMGTITMQLLEPSQSLMASLSSVTSCLGNTGPCFAEMGNLDSYAEVSMPGKFIYTALMVVGRLEYIAVIVLFSRSMWKKY